MCFTAWPLIITATFDWETNYKRINVKKIYIEKKRWKLYCLGTLAHDATCSKILLYREK